MSRSASTVLAVLLVAALAGCGTNPANAGAAASMADRPLLGPTVPAPTATKVAARVPRGALHPVGLDIPAIGVRTGPLLELGIDADGALEVPPDASAAGWYRLSPVPGAPGPAVIAAHVNWAGTQGVFARLHDLRPGAEITVRRSDGTRAVFTAYRVDRYPKSAFPSASVYGNTAGAELRLITCGGDYDAATRQYLDNVVAYVRLTGAT